MTTASISTTVATRKQDDPRALVRVMGDEFEGLLPSHIKALSWMRQAAGALRTGKINNETGNYLLEDAARNNPQAFVNALRRAAAQGLMPGTEEFYLTPRKIKNRWEILGITGYQGYIELMYRAGAAVSVKAVLVKEHDEFEYVEGRDDRPIHKIDWRSPDRGATVLVYSYAIMRTGAISQVIVLNEHDIERIKKASASARYDDSPWNTDTDKMWLKSAVRQLRKWVPTSAEYLTAQARAMEAAKEPHPLAGLNNPDDNGTSGAFVPDEDDVVAGVAVDQATPELIKLVGEKFTRAGVETPDERLDLARAILDREDATWQAMSAGDWSELAQWLDERYEQRQAEDAAQAEPAEPEGEQQ